MGVGYLTATAMVHPNFPECNWVIPAGSTDPYAWQFKAVASLGDGCTLALPYATPLNLVVNADGMPIDAKGEVIDRQNPLGRPSITTAMATATCSMMPTSSTRASSRCRTPAPPCTSIAMPSSSPPGEEARGCDRRRLYQSFEAVVAQNLRNCRYGPRRHARTLCPEGGVRRLAAHC